MAVICQVVMESLRNSPVRKVDVSALGTNQDTGQISSTSKASPSKI